MPKSKSPPARQKATSTRKQPRSVTAGSLLELQADGHHRAGLRLELQKLSFQEREDQLRLFSLGSSEKPEVAGLDLSVLQDRAVTALQKLLHATNYEGHQPVKAEDPEDLWKTPVRRLVLRFTWPEYYEAFGLKRRGDNRYSGKEEKDAREALLSLEKPFFITFKRHRWEGEGSARRQLVDRIEIARPLVNVTKAYKGLELAEDAAMDMEGIDEEKKEARVSYLIVEMSPLLSEGIENLYILKPNRLHEEIKLALGSKRNVSPSVHLFISWLLTKNMLLVRASKLTLAERLRLSSYVRQRKWKRLDEQLMECFEVATELGFLDAWKEQPNSVVEFQLNAERCSRAHHDEARDGE